MVWKTYSKVSERDEETKDASYEDKLAVSAQLKFLAHFPTRTRVPF